MTQEDLFSGNKDLVIHVSPIKWPVSCFYMTKELTSKIIEQFKSESISLERLSYKNNVIRTK